MAPLHSYLPIYGTRGLLTPPSANSQNYDDKCNSSSTRAVVVVVELVAAV